MTSKKVWLVQTAVAIVAALSVLCASARAVTVNFDTLPAGSYAGNALAALGVTFTTGTIPDSVNVGDVITLASPVSGFEVFNQPANAVSPPNFATALGVGTNDLLMSFSSPVTSVRVRTDHFSPESSDVVRLLALAPTGNPNEFQVLGIAQGSDNATSAPGDTLAVSMATPFSFALFQTTTEAEGFDDLTFFGPLAAPGMNQRGFALLFVALILLGTRALRRLPHTS